MKLQKYVHRTVTNGEWGVSYTTGSDIDGAILHVYRSRVAGVSLPYGKWLNGFGDGRLFPSIELAEQFAFEHGFIQLYFTHPDLRKSRKERGVRPYLGFLASARNAY